MRLIGRLTLIALMVPLPTGAKQLCHVLGPTFAEKSLVLVASDREATCQTNGAVTCWWEFPYRSGAAREAYANLAQDQVQLMAQAQQELFEVPPVVERPPSSSRKALGLPRISA